MLKCHTNAGQGTQFTRARGRMNAARFIDANAVISDDNNDLSSHGAIQLDTRTRLTH